MADKQDKIYYVERILNKRNQGPNVKLFFFHFPFFRNFHDFLFAGRVLREVDGLSRQLQLMGASGKLPSGLNWALQ